MSHLTKALRALACYEHDDMSIGDEAADEIERLGKQLAKWVDIFSEWDSPEDVHETLIGTAKDVNALKAEIERLRAALTYEENRFNRVGTHGQDCYKWGPSHYDCAMREIYSLQDKLAESLHLLEARDMEIESLQDKLAGTIGILEARNREIERLGELLAECQAREVALQQKVNAFYGGNPSGKIVADLEEQLTESQAREAKLRQALEKISTNGINWYASIKDAEVALKAEYERGYDSGFLVGAEKGRNISEEIKQAKREALLEAAEWFDDGYECSAANITARQLRRMAREIK